ncbi:hypothetical protein BB561_006009 [Smittium simulii]|uniref:RNA methyltransferase n=1 Tax=Smittium simulii TaxID=133385 RepID=A0A2T9Y778_9FUNG|nr:hypothetical protein BB561_006009 [Smittium simulii]
MKRKLEDCKSNNTNTYKYGNYPNYYTYRNPRNLASDPRLLAIPENILNESVCLDIGCNTGIITIELAKKKQIKKIFGVDIDQKLIKTARQNAYFANSLAFPNPDLFNESEATKDNSRWFSYFPISMPILYGTIPIKDQYKETKTSIQVTLDDNSNSELQIEDTDNCELSTNDSLIDESVERPQSELALKVSFFAADWVYEDTDWIYPAKYDVIFA